jgi:hypothetical protein
VSTSWAVQINTVVADEAKSSSRMLTGGVVHSEQLTPLPPALAPGNTFMGESSLTPQVSAQAPATVASAQPTRGATPTKSSTPAAFKSSSSDFSVPNYPQKRSATTVSDFQKRQAVNNSKVTAQFKDYLKQQAALGNNGTRGLDNFLQENKMGTMHKHGVHPATVLLTTKLRANAAKPAQPAVSKLQRFMIPDWLAGEWSRTESNETSRTQLPGGRKLKPFGKTTTKVTDSFGNAKDNAHIYQVFDPVHATGSVDRGENIDYHHVSFYDISLPSSTSALVKVRATHVVVNKKTHRITTAYQDEEFNTYTLVKSNQLKTDSSVKVFDQRGKATLLTQAVSMESKIR